MIVFRMILWFDVPILWRNVGFSRAQSVIIRMIFIFSSRVMGSYLEFEEDWSNRSIRFWRCSVQTLYWRDAASELCMVHAVYVQQEIMLCNWVSSYNVSSISSYIHEINSLTFVHCIERVLHHHREDMWSIYQDLELDGWYSFSHYLHYSMV